MTTYIYEVSGQFAPGKPDESRAFKSKTSAAHFARLLGERGAHIITVTAAVPLPRQLPWGETDTTEEPGRLGGHLEGICVVLNGQWFSKKYRLISFYANPATQKMPKDLFSQVLKAKVDPDTRVVTTPVPRPKTLVQLGREWLKRPCKKTATPLMEAMRWRPRGWSWCLK